MQQNNRIEWLCLIVLTAATVIACFRSPENASDLEIVPDSVEYCAGAYNLVANGRYEIQLDDQWFPPRYSPWFSAFFLMPAYVVSPRTLGAPIIVILMMSILAVLMAYRVGRSVSGVAGGLSAAALLLLLPSFRESSMTIMTDVPCTALCLTAAAIYLGLTREASSARWMITGLVCALASSIRPLTAALCLPFLLFILMKRPNRSLLKLLALLLPTILMTAMTLLYNRFTFGTFLRSGYNFWCAVPYDYFSLTFGPQFASMNSATLLLAGRYAIPVLLLMLMLSLRYKTGSGSAEVAHSHTARLMLFTVTALGPLLLIHLFYFFPEQRFFLPFLALISVAAGGLAGLFLNQRTRTSCILLLAAIVLVSIAIRIQIPAHLATRRSAADMIDRLVPDKTTIISGVDPAYLSLALRHRNMRFLPISRTVEYASKVITRSKADDLDPFPSDSSDHRAAALFEGDHDEVISHTADEMIETIATRIRQGQVYILETGNITALEYPSVLKLMTIFPMKKINPDLFELGPPSEQSFAPAD